MEPAPDKDASYTRTAKGSHYGYKAHVSCDGEHQLIRNALISTGGMRGSAHVRAKVAPQDTEEIYADKAYDTKSQSSYGCASGESKIAS